MMGPQPPAVVLMNSTKVDDEIRVKVTCPFNQSLAVPPGKTAAGALNVLLTPATRTVKV